MHIKNSVDEPNLVLQAVSAQTVSTLQILDDVGTTLAFFDNQGFLNTPRVAAPGSNQALVLEGGPGTGDIVFNAGSATRMTIKAPGKVGIGTTSPSQPLQVESNVGGEGLAVRSTATGIPPAYLRLEKSNNGSTVAAGNVLGKVLYSDWNGSAFGEGASIAAAVPTGLTWGSSDHPANLVFFTTPDATATPQERMRIESSGPVPRLAVPSRLEPMLRRFTSRRAP
jgi:hypothetical protein